MILVYGTVCLDRLCKVARLPEPGGYVGVESVALRLGGEAANSASHLARWKADFELWGNAFTRADNEGALLEAYLADAGLSLHSQGSADRPAPACDIYITPDGERTMFGFGFNAMDLPIVGEFSPKANWFTLDGNVIEEGDAHAVCDGQVQIPKGNGFRSAEAALQIGIKLYAMDVPRNWPLLGPNAVWQSSARWQGTRGETRANEAIVRDIVESTGCMAILTDGGNGFLGGSLDMPVRWYPPFPGPAVVDPTGAGDAFRAGMLHGLDRLLPLSDSIRFAAAAASLSAGYLGGSSGPSAEDVDTLISEHPGIARQYD